MTNWQDEPEDPPRTTPEEPDEEEPWPEWTFHRQRMLLRAWEVLATMHLPEPDEYDDDYYPQLDEEPHVTESDVRPGDESK